MNKWSRITAFLGAAWLVLLVVVAFTAPWLPLPGPQEFDLGRALLQPTSASPFGTDELGREVFSRIIYAAQGSLLVTAGATALNIVLGLIIGAAAGFWGGWLDRFLGFCIDFFWSVPFIIFVVLIVSVIGVTPASLILTIGLTNWVTSARVIHAEVSRFRQLDFIRAARAYGFSDGQIAGWHLLPNLKGTLLTLSAYGAVEVLTIETGLAFIGLSLPAPRPTWGGLLAEGLSYFSSAWWLAVSSAVVITLTLASLQAMAHYFDRNAKVLA